jgi:hypothetical protein
MKTLKVVLLMVVLLSVAMLAGCQEGYARQDDLTKKKKVIWEPTGTGFWHPKLTHAAAN